jgi:hypothetical protein
MKRSLPIAFILIALSGQCRAVPTILYVEFDWTPQPGFNQYTTFFLYSGGTTVNGIFTPSSVLNYSIGSPFGPITPATHYPGLTFYTDTPLGPSFQVQGTIQPKAFEEISGNNLDLDFQGLTESTAYFTGGQTLGANLTGTWTETIVTAPDAANSLLLLGLGLVALGGFHAFYRARATAR